MNMQNIIVTGSNGGIGKSLVLKLLKNNHQVIGLDINKSDISNPNYFHFICDITNENDIKRCFVDIESKFKHIDIICNIAGIFMLQTLIEGSEDDLRKIIEVNFWGIYRLNRSLFPLLKENSRIIVFSSEVARYSPQPFNGYYALSKILVDKYADVLRRELNYLNIKVIKVQSGAIKTNLLNGVNEKYQTTIGNTKYYKKPLTKLKKLMDDEINKQVSSEVAANALLKIIEKKNPKILYKIKNSFKLRFLNKLPERLQDYIYKKVIK